MVKSSVVGASSADSYRSNVQRVLAMVPKPPPTGSELVDAQASASHALVVTMAVSMFTTETVVLPMYEHWSKLQKQHEQLQRVQAEASEVLKMSSFHQLDESPAI